MITLRRTTFLLVTLVAMIFPLHKYVFAGGPSTIEAYDNGYRQGGEESAKD